MTPDRITRVYNQIRALQAGAGQPPAAPQFSHQTWCRCYESPRATLRSCMCAPCLEIGGKSFRVDPDGVVRPI